MSEPAAHASAPFPLSGTCPTGTPQPVAALRLAAPLSDAAILEVALQVRDAIRRPPPDDHTTWILSAAAELAPADEDRVIAALAHRGSPPWELAR